MKLKELAICGGRVKTSANHSFLIWSGARRCNLQQRQRFRNCFPVVFEIADFDFIFEKYVQCPWRSPVGIWERDKEEKSQVQKSNQRIGSCGFLRFQISNLCSKKMSNIPRELQFVLGRISKEKVHLKKLNRFLGFFEVPDFTFTHEKYGKCFSRTHDPI